MHSQSSNSSPWLTNTNPVSFFHEKVAEAQRRHSIKLTENVEYYIVNLLCDYVNISTHKETEDCLFFLLKKALESSHGTKVVLYKKLADTALYFSGFFQEYFSNKSFDIKYYVSMGESAYNELANLMRKNNVYDSTMSQIYKEMSDNFMNSVDVILDVSEQTINKDNLRSTASIYEAWLSTASSKLEKELLERGMFPIKISGEKC